MMSVIIIFCGSFTKGSQTAVHITHLPREITSHTWTTSGNCRSYLTRKCLVFMRTPTLQRTRRRLKRWVTPVNLLLCMRADNAELIIFFICIMVWVSVESYLIDNLSSLKAVSFFCICSSVVWQHLVNPASSIGWRWEIFSWSNRWTIGRYPIQVPSSVRHWDGDEQVPCDLRRVHEHRA